MGFVGTLVMPLVVFIVLGRAFGAGKPVAAPQVDIPFNAAILAAVLIAISAVQSLVAIISIYREGGILKRLRSTPLSPVTIMGAQVAVKLVFTVISLALLMLAGRRLFPGVMRVNVFSFTVAVLLSTFSILSLGFVIASLVPTARFAQPDQRCGALPDAGPVGAVLSSGPAAARAQGARVPAPDHTRRGAPRGRVGRIGLGRALGERRGVARAVRCVHRPLDQGLPLGVIWRCYDSDVTVSHHVPGRITHRL